MRRPTLFLRLWKQMLFLLVCIIQQSTLLAQQEGISGRVTTADGKPLAGATVQFMGTKAATATDENGVFTFKTSASEGTFTVSMSGYKSQVLVIHAGTRINIVMQEDTKDLQDVVVVGYGTQKKTSLLGSISTVKSADITKVPATNLSQALVGKLPGLITRQSSGLPGSDDVDLYVRGFGSLNKNSPLILVDGVERSFANLDPSEIESVTILKDAASASVYGVRGATGVILVTTKRGKESKTTLTYSGSLTSSSNTRMPEYLNGEEFVKWYNYADEINGRTHTFPDAVVNKIVNGDTAGIFGNTNWVNKILKSSTLTTQHNLSVSGGTQTLKYFVLLGYLNQQGIIKGVDYSRYNLRSNIDATVTNDLSISLDVSANTANANSPQISNFSGNGNTVSINLMNQIMVAHPYLNPTSPDGKYLTSSLQSGNNPMAARDLSGYNDNDNTALQTSLSLNYKAPFLKGLTFKVVGSFDKNYYHTKSFYTPYTLATVDPTQPSPSIYETASPYGTVTILSESYTQASRWTLQEYIKYDRSFNKHTVGAMIVAEQSSYKYTGLGASAQNFDLNDLDEFGFAKDNPSRPYGSSGTTNRVGWVSRLNYIFDNRYLAEFSGRVDASTNFPKNNRYGFFPSVSVGWRISNESFFNKLHSTVNDLKLTASYGILGNDVTNGSYEYLRFMSLTTSPVANIGGTNVNGLLPTSFPNANLTWEKAKTANIGLTAELWKGLLGIELNAFYKVTTDILTSVSSVYPPSVGGYYPSTVNSGKVDNRGFELVLKHRSHIGELNYNITGSVSWAHNRILNMDQSAGIPEYLSMIGRSMGVKTGLIAEGLFATDAEAKTSPALNSAAQAGDIKYKDLNGDGKITYEQDVTIIGRSSLPELNYSVAYDASYKRFEASFLIQGAAICDNALMGFYDGIGWDDTQFTRPFYNGGNSPKYVVENAWTPQNTSGKYPRLDNQWRPNNNWASSMWIVNGAYLRLKNVQVAYNLGGKINSGFQAKIYVAAMNLVTLSSFKYLDPEAPNVSNGYYPQQKTISAGVRVTF